MPEILSVLFPGVSPGGLAVLVAATFLGGVVRGFSGFGFAMVFMPLASLVLGPVAALALIWVIDIPFALWIGARAVRRAEMREVLPLLAAATVMLPVGLWLLLWFDRQTMRWLLAGLVLAAVALLASGWRYHGRPGLPLAFGVGAMSGLCNGLAAIGGMPLAVFWLGAKRNDHHRTRTNMQAYIGLSTVTGTAIVIWKGVLDLAAAKMALPLFAVYGAGLWLGSHAFGLASERTFRRIAYLTIFLSALASLPLWDGWLGR